MDTKRLNELKKESKLLNAVARIGKNGLTENQMSQIKMLLKKKRLIKIKVLRNCLDKSTIDGLIEEIVSKCECILIDKIGLTFSLYK